MAKQAPVPAIQYDWKKEKTDEETGELMTVDKYRYFPGSPVNYRANMKEGEVNINGTKRVGDSFSFQPMAWVAFEGEILNQGNKRWLLFFFIDENNNVAYMLIHSHSVEAFEKYVSEELFYSDLTPAQVVLTMTFKKLKAEKIQGKPEYCIAEFTHSEADKSRTRELLAYAKEHKLYVSQLDRDAMTIHYAEGCEYSPS